MYSYVLDEKEVNIDILRENVRTYQELEKTLDSVKRRIAKLEIIEGHHAQVLDGLAKDRMYDYFLQRAEADILGEAVFGDKKSDADGAIPSGTTGEEDQKDGGGKE